MTVVGLQDFLSSAIARQVKPAALQAPATALPQAPVNATPVQNASLSSIPAQSLSTVSYTSTSSNLAQLGSVLQVSGSGVSQVQQLVQQLQTLAGQAAGPGVSSASLAKIDSQFQQLLAQINRVASGTTFAGASVLDGTSLPVTVAPSGNAPQAAHTVTLPTITLTTLFGAETPNLLTTQNAAQAVKSLSNAKESVDQVSSDLEEAQGQLEYASASLQTALSNIDASKAVISDADASGLFENLLGGLLDTPVAAAQLQTGNLSPSLLSLLQE